MSITVIRIIYIVIRLFETIAEQSDRRDQTPPSPPPELSKMRRKSSKKVSIAENLNCDYSDDNLTDMEEVGEETNGDMEKSVVLEEESRQGRQNIVIEILQYLGGLSIELFIYVIFILVSLMFEHPMVMTVIFLALIISNVFIYPFI